MNDKMKSRKFMLASLSLIAGIVALFSGKLMGIEFNYLVGIILTAYGAANVIPTITKK